MVDYSLIAKESRFKCLELVYNAQTSHIGSLFSSADIFSVLFEKIDLDKDKFILSAGWKAAMLYYHLWRKGRITVDELNSYCQAGSKFIGLSEPIHPDISFAGGSMGLGFPAAVGFALAKKMKREEGVVYCLMSDGEMQVGMTYESALIAAHHNLNNLIVLLDYNKLQAMGRTNEILRIEPIVDKWVSWGWKVIETDGHDYTKIEDALSMDFAPEPLDLYLGGDTLPYHHLAYKIARSKPLVIVFHTIKGKGVSFMADNNDWHYRSIDKESYELAQQELR